MKIRIRDGSIHQANVNTAVHIVLRADYVHWYDALKDANPKRIDLFDLAYPAYLDAVPNFRALLSGQGSSELQRRLEVASKRLARIPLHASLETWQDTSENRASLNDLFRSCTGGRNDGLPQFGPARCTKLLHKKRPGLIPIIDSWQLEAWGHSSSSWSTSAMVDVVYRIRQQMAPYLEEYREVQRALESRSPSIPHLTPPRIYDILFWEMTRRFDA